MHVCLNVDEILRPIAHELVASEGMGSAIALACCRKSFEEPVLDVLWVKQDRLLPLLKSFPGDVWDDEKCTVSPSTMCFLLLLNDSVRKSFKRLPTTTERARFRKYARRMRELKEYSTPNVLSLETLSALLPRTINEPLFPNLKTLYFRDVRGPFVPFIPLFLSLRVTSIDLGFVTDVPKAMVASVVSSFPTLCPRLQSISLQCLPKDPMITTAVSKMVLATNRNTLQQLDVDSPLMEEASEVVCELPNVRNLSVVIENSLPSASLPNL